MLRSSVTNRREHSIRLKHKWQDTTKMNFRSIKFGLEERGSIGSYCEHSNGRSVPVRGEEHLGQLLRNDFYTMELTELV
jgi:hypothetical protein